MALTKLELYVKILKVIALGGTLKRSKIASELGIEGSALRRPMAFLLQQGLIVESRLSNQSSVYSIAQRGIIVLNHFRELKQTVPVLTENFIS